MIHEQHPQWRDEQSASKFPFEDNATLESDQSGFVLTPEVFLDMVLYPPATNGRLYLSSITLTNQTLRFNFGDDDDELICFAELPLTEADAFQIGVLDLHDRDAGVLVTEPLRIAALTAWPAGVYRFTQEATSLVAAACLSPDLEGVTALQAGTEVLSHEVWLVGDDGVVLSVTSPSSLRHVIRVDFVGDPLFRRRQCEPGLFQTPRFLRQVVFQSGDRSHTAVPDASGNIAISVDARLAQKNVLRIQATEGAVVLEAAGEQLQGIR